MTGLSFPRHGAGGRQISPPAPGRPERAKPCACIGGPQLFNDDDLCSRCGRYPALTIAGTWAERAKHLARVAEGRRNREARKRGKR